MILRYDSNSGLACLAADLSVVAGAKMETATRNLFSSFALLVLFKLTKNVPGHLQLPFDSSTCS